MPAERLQKLMAQAGIASRRHAEALISEGRVTVNGDVAKVGDKADLATDDVRVDGSRLRVQEQRIYLVINKPKGVVTAVSAQEQEPRRTVRDLVPLKGHLYPVGRLDVDSEGLVLLTNDGELAQKLSHPRYEHPKVYEVALAGNVPDEALDIWRRGIVLDDGPTKPVEVRVTGRDKEITWVKVTMQEGRKRQIRRIASLLGYPVRKLVRVQFDTLTLGGLKSGEWRYLSEGEIAKLQLSAKNLPSRAKPRRSTHIARSTSRSSGRSRAAHGTARSGEGGSAPRSRSTSGHSRSQAGRSRTTTRGSSRPGRPQRSTSQPDTRTEEADSERPDRDPRRTPSSASRTSRSQHSRKPTTRRNDRSR